MTNVTVINSSNTTQKIVCTSGEWKKIISSSGRKNDRFHSPD